jgi:hypothetical protein
MYVCTCVCMYACMYQVRKEKSNIFFHESCSACLSTSNIKMHVYAYLKVHAYFSRHTQIHEHIHKYMNTYTIKPTCTHTYAHTYGVFADLGRMTVGHIREVCMHVHTHTHTHTIRNIHTYMHTYIGPTQQRHVHQICYKCTHTYTHTYKMNMHVRRMFLFRVLIDSMIHSLTYTSVYTLLI